MFAIVAGCTDEANAPLNLAPFAMGDASYPSDADRRVDGEGDEPTLAGVARRTSTRCDHWSPGIVFQMTRRSRRATAASISTDV